MQNALKPSTGVAATVVGFLALLFGASGVFFELRSSLNTVWGARDRGFAVKGYLKERLFSFAMVVAIGFLLLVSLLVSAAVAAAGRFVGDRLPVPAPLLEFANLLVSFFVATVLFGLIFKTVPDVRIAWRDVWLGAAVTAMLFSAGKLLIGMYLGKASIGSAYGAAGSVVIILVWVYYSAQVFFMGAEFTRLFAERYGSRSRAARKRAALSSQHVA
jgi:membrane protein